jgi:hypothetical protein
MRQINLTLKKVGTEIKEEEVYIFEEGRFVRVTTEMSPFEVRKEKILFSLGSKSSTNCSRFDVYETNVEEYQFIGQVMFSFRTNFKNNIWVLVRDFPELVEVSEKFSEIFPVVQD